MGNFDKTEGTIFCITILKKVNRAEVAVADL